MLDANVFIQAARNYYAFDIVPGFWEALVSQAESRDIQSIDRVLDEIKKGKDALAQWVQGPFNAAFGSTDAPDIVQAFAEMMAWVQNHAQFSDPAKAEFAASADGWLVAFARVRGCVLVTHETLDLNIKRKVKIPNVCQAFGVPFIDTFEMLRRLGVRFV